MSEQISNPSLKQRKKLSIRGLLWTTVIVCLVFFVCALPRVWINFNQFARKSRTIEAWAELRHVYTLQQKYHDQHGVYASTTEELGFSPTTPRKNSRYEISVQSASNNAFVAVAVAKGLDVIKSGCKHYDQWEINQEKSIYAVADCTATDGLQPLIP